MLLRITNTTPQATDLGFLLHKNPANLFSADLTFGKVHVFYSEATAERCTACLLVEIDPVGLVRGSQQLDDYVNDRPYVASSYVSVAMGRAFGTALAGNCNQRPELVDTKMAVVAEVEVVAARGGAEVLHKLFDPLGYTVDVSQIPLDEKLTGLGESPYFRMRLEATATVHDVLSHLYVLLPVLDTQKHYYVGDAEVEKLLRHGEGWLSRHPERQLIVTRYLKRKPSLIDEAFERLVEEDGAPVESIEQKKDQARRRKRSWSGR